jgi:predicted nucleic acid-binding protein
MQPVLFDSSIYITALRTGDEAALSLRRLAVDSPIWLSAVVLEELYAGIAPRGRHVLERFERDFEKARRILVPNLNDWTQAGKVLARLAAKYDYEKIGQGRLTNDALIHCDHSERARFPATGRVPSLSMESPRFYQQLTLSTRSGAVVKVDSTH